MTAAVPALPPASALRALRLFTTGSLLAVAGFVAVLCLRDLPAGALGEVARAAVLVSTPLAAALFVMGLHPRLSRAPGVLTFAAAAAALTACVAGQAGGGQLWPWVTPSALVAAAALAHAPDRKAPVSLLVAGVTGAATAAATGDWWTGVTGAVAYLLCLAALLAQLWVQQVAERADQARRGAVTAERDRFAAELHDIQGHTLQVIVLKSELAARLAGADPGRAAAEMRQVETLAREALRDTREVVHGYRPVSLTDEIANAARILAAAGVQCHTPSSIHVSPEHERLLALLVREATTNMLRHSTATRAGIIHTAGSLTIVNDAPLATLSATASPQRTAPSMTLQPTDPSTTPEGTKPPTTPQRTERPTTPQGAEPPTTPQRTEPPTTPQGTEPPTTPQRTEPPTTPQGTEPSMTLQGTAPSMAPSDELVGGGGLTTLARRFAAAGGELRWQRTATSFEVNATLP
ncbi:sensor histidine kinase [Actinoplanes sp. RD1]|uniref:sensor histidine kinase n=1 Tax=Actinoplanes sp. RD1 TaxID=3064538 RepID=UPI0027424BE7|nr:histidine kinase [Actinoplanes sp. RD1]